MGIESLRELLIQYALMFYNAPYRWGGRTPNGVDGAGLVQMVYRLAGIAIPRYIDQQAGAGQVLSFLEEAQPGILLSLVILPVLLLMSVSCGNRDELSMLRESPGG